MKNLRVNFMLSKEEEEAHASILPKNGYDQSSIHFIEHHQEIDFCEKLEGEVSLLSQHSAGKNNRKS